MKRESPDSADQKQTCFRGNPSISAIHPRPHSQDPLIQDNGIKHDTENQFGVHRSQDYTDQDKGESPAASCRSGTIRTETLNPGAFNALQVERSRKIISVCTDSVQSLRDPYPPRSAQDSLALMIIPAPTRRARAHAAEGGRRIKRRSACSGGIGTHARTPARLKPQPRPASAEQLPQRPIRAGRRRHAGADERIHTPNCHRRCLGRARRGRGRRRDGRRRWLGGVVAAAGLRVAALAGAGVFDALGPAAALEDHLPPPGSRARQRMCQRVSRPPKYSTFVVARVVSRAIACLLWRGCCQ
jgi:hypothetical protein